MSDDAVIHAEGIGKPGMAEKLRKPHFDLVARTALPPMIFSSD